MFSVECGQQCPAAKKGGGGEEAAAAVSILGWVGMGGLGGLENGKGEGEAKVLGPTFRTSSRRSGRRRKSKSKGEIRQSFQRDELK